MSFFNRPTAVSVSVHDRLADISLRLNNLVHLIEVHVETTSIQGERILALPDEIILRVIEEARSATRLALAAAWITVRKAVFEEISKWIWRAILGYGGVRMLDFLHNFANNLSTGGISQ